MKYFLRFSYLLSFALMISAVLLFSSCSFVSNKIDSKLDEMGLADEGEKVKEAWNDIGKEAVEGVIDDTLDTLEFKKSKTWPESGTALYIPKPLYEKLTAVNDNGKSGIIEIDSFTGYEFRKYTDALKSDDFSLYNDIEPLVYVKSETGIAVCPLYSKDDEKLTLYYAENYTDMTLLLSQR